MYHPINPLLFWSLGLRTIIHKGAFETILAKKYIHFDAISYWHESWEMFKNYAQQSTSFVSDLNF